LCRARPEGDDAVLGWLGTFTDIDDQKRAQRRASFLSEAGTLLASASLDHAATLRRISQLVVPRLADWCIVDLVGASGQLERLVVTHADPAQAALADRLRALPPDDAALAREGGVVGGAPHELGVSSSMVVPMRAGNRAVGVLTFVSTHAIYDGEDLTMADGLAHRAALAVDNARLYREAQDAIHARDEFLLVAAHELKTPLTALQLQVQGIQRAVRPEDVDPAELHARLVHKAEVASRAADRLARLIDVVLDVSRLERGRLALEREPMELAALTRDVVGRLAEEATAAGCAVAIHAAECHGCWDRARLEQVVTNLLSNAFKYGAGQPVEIAIADEGDDARLEVRDHGIGIAEGQQRRVFERFARAVSERNYGGLGLGLFIASEIVGAHGGEITVASAPGDGATFVIKLPKKRA
jgi:signal transduction histidine kinase